MLWTAILMIGFLPPHVSPFIGRVRRHLGQPCPCQLIRMRQSPDGPMGVWILEFANDRLTIPDFRDVRVLAV